MSDGSISSVTQTTHSAALGGARIIEPAAIEALQEIAGDDDPEFLLEVIDLFLDDSGQRIDDLRQAARAQDPQAAARAAHALKSASSSVGASALAAGCEQIERALREGEEQDLGAQVGRVEGMFAEVQQVLLSLKSSTSGAGGVTKR